MDNFVSVITRSEITDDLVEAANQSSNVLMESSEEYVIGEDEDGNNVLRLPLDQQLTETEADSLAESIASRLFEMGHDEFDIEITGGNGFDAVNDIIVYMRNNPGFYRREYFPAVLRLKSKKTDAETAFGQMVDKAMGAYCHKYELGRPDNVFKNSDRSAIIKKIYSEESENISKGEYD